MSRTIHDLQPEVLCKIFSYVEYASRLQIAGVCKVWRATLTLPQCWPDISLRAKGVYPSPPTDELCAWFESRCSQLQQLVLRNFDLEDSPLLGFASRNSAALLTHLNLELVCGVDFAQVSDLKNLKQLLIRHCECSRFPIFVTQLPSLEVLDCRPLSSGQPTFWVLPPSITYMKSLKQLHLASLRQLHFPPELQLLTSLQHLQLDTVRSGSGFNHLPISLTRLDLSYCWGCLPPSPVLNSLTNLRSLRITSCGRKNLTPDWLTSLKLLEEYLVEEDTQEWYINLDTLAKLANLTSVRFEVDEYLGPAMLFLSGQAPDQFAQLPRLRSFYLLRASGLGALSFLVMNSLVQAFFRAGRQLEVTYDVLRGLPQSNPEDLDLPMLRNRDSFLVVRYGPDNKPVKD